MNVQDYEQLTLFPEDFPASPSVWLESKREKKMIVTYGLKCCELSENLRRVGLLVRTYLESSRLPGGEVVKDLEQAGYDCVVFAFEAAAVGAPHRRARVAFVANADGIGSRKERHQPNTDKKWDDKAPEQKRRPELCKIGCCSKTVCNTDREVVENSIRHRYKTREQRFAIRDWWAVEPNVGRVAHGVPNWVDRLKCLGNAVVPQQFYPIFAAIAQVEDGAV